MNRMQALQMTVQVMQLVVTTMVLTVELRRLAAQLGERERGLAGPGAEPRRDSPHHTFIPLLLDPGATLAQLLRAAAPAVPARASLPWTALSQTSSPPIVLAT